MRQYYVYILRCADGTHYTGVTNDYVSRVSDHQAGIDPRSYTFNRRPVTLVRVEEFGSVIEAISREKQLKRWSRAKKNALIMGDIERLQQLSKAKNGSTSLPAGRQAHHDM